MKSIHENLPPQQAPTRLRGSDGSFFLRKSVSVMVADMGTQLAGFVCVFAEEDAVFGSSVRPSDA